MNEKNGNSPKSSVAGKEIDFRRLIPAKQDIASRDDLTAALRRSNLALGRLDTAASMVPGIGTFTLMFLRQEAVNSSRIEGTQSTLIDVIESEATNQNGTMSQDLREVVNHLAALHYGLNSDLPFSIRLIKEIHEVLMKKVRGNNKAPGQLRKVQNYIGPEGCTIAEATFVPPPPQEVADLLSGLEAFVNADDGFDPLVKAGIMHAQFETIHPFLDGNGRVGRVLITLMLCKGEKPPLSEPIFFLSRYFLLNQQGYYDALNRYRSQQGWLDWLTFFLKGIEESSEYCCELVMKILAMRERHRKLVIDNYANLVGPGLQVLEHLFKMPFITVNLINEITGKPRKACYKLLERLEQSDILAMHPSSRKRNRLYTYKEYLALFRRPRSK